MLAGHQKSFEFGRNTLLYESFRNFSPVEDETRFIITTIRSGDRCYNDEEEKRELRYTKPHCCSSTIVLSLLTSTIEGELLKGKEGFVAPSSIAILFHWLSW